MNNSVSRRSKLIRFVLWLVVIVAFVALVLQVYEWFHLFQSVSDEHGDRIVRLIGLVIVNFVFAGILVMTAGLFLWVRMAKSLPDLQGWHLQRPESEFCAADADGGFTLDDYLKQEAQVFDELDAYITGEWANQSPGAFSRFQKDSVCNPEKIADRNWNRSHVMPSANPIGGVLLLHGLSDSPYSLRALGKRLHSEGYTVIWLRIPGHGTCPNALANVVWQDWAAAVRVAMQGLHERLPSNSPLVLAGYSNGGALSVHYALATLNDNSLPKLQAILLFSPMIGINPMARITRLYHTVGLVSRNEKARWSNVDAEIDPFKYCSWPMNANVQAWSMTQAVEKQLAALEKAGRMSNMPPVLAMQSVVDSTVIVPKLITALFDRLKSNTSELFLFDINRVDQLGNLFNLSFEQKIAPKLENSEQNYTLTALRNVQTDAHRVSVYKRSGESWIGTKTEYEWPDGVASLSHIAVPIPPDDPVYGTAEATAAGGISLGTLSLRSEPSALLISNSLFFRCRNNPFYQLMEDRVVEWLTENTEKVPSQ